MVSSIVPGTSSNASALSIDTRLTKPAGANGAARQEDSQRAGGDSVEIGASASWSAARESVRQGVEQIDQALDVGQQALDLLTQIRDAKSEEEAKGLLKQLADKIDTAIKGGATLLGGKNLQVQAEPGATPLTVEGVDVQIKDEAGETIVVGAQTAWDASFSDKVQKSIDNLSGSLSQLRSSARALSTHQSLLGAAEGAIAGVTNDLDADSARIMALQAKQGLASLGGSSIANADPQSVLSLFRN